MLVKVRKGGREEKEVQGGVKEEGFEGIFHSAETDGRE